MSDDIWVLFSQDEKDILYASNKYVNVEQVKFKYMSVCSNPYCGFHIGKVSEDDERYIEYRKEEKEVEEYGDI